MKLSPFARAHLSAFEILTTGTSFGLATDGVGFYSKEKNVFSPNIGVPDSQSDNFPANHLISYVRYVANGEPFQLPFKLWPQGSASVERDLDSASDSTDADAYWNGVSTVTTLDGVPVTDFSLSNDAGVDFGNSFAPIPEPAHYAALVGNGLLAFAFGRRLCRVHAA